jgi:hypothetical protein
MESMPVSEGVLVIMLEVETWKRFVGFDKNFSITSVLRLLQ